MYSLTGKVMDPLCSRLGSWVAGLLHHASAGFSRCIETRHAGRTLPRSACARNTTKLFLDERVICTCGHHGDAIFCTLVVCLMSEVVAAGWTHALEFQAPPTCSSALRSIDALLQKHDQASHTSFFPPPSSQHTPTHRTHTSCLPP